MWFLGKQPRSKVRKTLQPRFESLEYRDCPSVVPGPGVNLAPTITDFGVVHEHDNIWTFRGTIQDEDVGNCLITLSGLQIIEGQVVTVSDEGEFGITVAIAPGVEGLVHAIAKDFAEQVSVNAQTYLNNPESPTGSPPPETPPPPPPETPPAPPPEAPPAPPLEAPPAPPPEVPPVTPPPPETPPAPPPAPEPPPPPPVDAAPTITTFQVANQGGNTWMFFGTVADENAGSVVVTLNGISGLRFVRVPVNSLGEFSIIVTLPTGAGGWATAIAKDASNLCSVVMRAFVVPVH